MQGLRFNSSLLFLHSKHSGYIDSPLLYRLVIHGMIRAFTAILTKREGALHSLDGQFVLSFIVSVPYSVITHKMTMKDFKLPNSKIFFFFAQIKWFI